MDVEIENVNELQGRQCKKNLRLTSMSDAAYICVFVHKSMLLSVQEIETDKPRTRCSTGSSLSSSALTGGSHITKAELSKQKIIETNSRVPREAEYCNCNSKRV